MGKNTGFEKNAAKQELGTSPFMPQMTDDPYFIEGKDPNRAYKDISFARFRKEGFRDSRGWVPLTPQNKTTEQIPDPTKDYGAHVASDGFWHRGDCIVAWMPIEVYKQMRAKVASMTKAQTDAIGGDTKKIAKQGNIGLTEEFSQQKVKH